MKKIQTIVVRIIIMAIMITAIMIIGLPKAVSADIGQWDDIRNIGADQLIGSSNVYCVGPGQLLDYARTYIRVLEVSINGDEVYFEVYTKANDGGNGGREYVGSVQGNTCEANNILAAILSRGGGYGPSKGNYSDTQLGVFQFWGTWLSQSGAGGLGGAGWSSSSSTGSSVLSQAKSAS